MVVLDVVGEMVIIGSGIERKPNKSFSESFTFFHFEAYSFDKHTIAENLNER